MVNRKFIGLSNKQNGANWEKMIEKSLNTFYSTVCVCEKTPEPFHMLGPLGKGLVKGYYEKKGQPDFKGVLEGGQCICFEAKFTSTDKIRYDCVTELQKEILTKYAEMGALCFVMVCYNYNTYCRIPWKDWQNMKKLFGHKYISEQESEQYRCKTCGDCICLLDGIELKD